MSSGIPEKESSSLWFTPFGASVRPTCLVQNIVEATAPQPVSSARLTLQWRHNGHDGVSNHQPHDCLFYRLLRRRSKKTLKLRVTGLCAGNSPVTGEFPAHMASNAENVSIGWRLHVAILSADLDGFDCICRPKALQHHRDVPIRLSVYSQHLSG